MNYGKTLFFSLDILNVYVYIGERWKQMQPQKCAMNEKKHVPCDRPGCPGFTLIELLTVIAILALLMAVLIPVSMKALEAARRTQCASNLRQLAVAIHSYIGDNQGKYPDIEWYRQYEQCELLHPYLPEPRSYVCPTANADGSSGGNWPEYYSTEINGIEYTTDYKMNDSMNIRGRNIVTLPSPAEFILACDLDWTDVLRHGGKGNFVFYDGRVRAMDRFESNQADSRGNSPWYDWGTTR